MNWKLFIIGIIVVIPFSLAGCISTDENEDELPLLITIKDVANQGVDVGTTSSDGENYVTRRYLNGTTEVEYEYDSDNDPANSSLVIFYSEADTHRNDDLARDAFHDAVDAYLLGAEFGNSDVQVVEVPGSFTLGEQNYSAVIQSDGVNMGNLVVTQKGNLVYSLILGGPYIQYKQTLINLIGPKLEAFGE